MKAQIKIGFAVVAGFALGAITVDQLHAQAGPPAYVISEITLTDPDAYAREYVPLANKALAVARTLADSPEIRQGLQKKPQESGIQAIAEAVRKRNDLLFIVVTDMQSLRYSHPEAQRIGQPFKGDDILKALNGKENVAINRGFLAQALRVFTPIYDENHKQIGVVAIGLELSRVTQQINDSRWSIIWSVLFGMLVGLIGTCILVKVLKKILFGLEPYEISTLFEQRQAMLQSRSRSSAIRMNFGT